MPAGSSIEIDLINVADGQKLRTVRLSVVPHVGDELDLDLGSEGQAVYRVTQVLHHIRPRKVVRTDDLIGVSVFVEQINTR
jgi:hypothetical protein